MSLSFNDVSDRLSELGLISQGEFQEFLSGMPPSGQPLDAEQVLQALVQGKRLTTWQARQIGAGQGQGLVLGNYVILDKLGQGGMGEVFKAQHLRMQRVVALKILSPQVTDNPEALKRFQREAVAAARLLHPNVVAAYDADEAKGTHFLVMEHVPGRDLARLVRETGVLSVGQALRCIIQAARGLEYAHGQGVVHRDVKPSNLLLDASGVVKVLDLGLARIESAAGQSHDITSTGDILGTVDFMAPEQAENTRLADARSDVYSLGMTLWFLLTGRPGYERDSLASKIMAHRTAPIPSLREVRPEVSKELDEVFQKLVAKDPRERFQNMSEVLAALEGCFAESASTVQTSSDDNELAVRLSSISRREVEEETVIFVKPAVESTRLGASAPTLPAQPSAPVAAQRSRTPLAIALAFLGGAALILLTVFLLAPLRGDNVLVEVTDSEVSVVIDKGAVKIVGAASKKLRLREGEHSLAVTRGETELSETFTVAKGKSTTLEIEVVDGVLRVNQDGQVLAQVALAKPTGAAPVLPNGKFVLDFAPGSKVEIGSLKLDRNGELTLEAFVTTQEGAAGKSGVLLGTPQQFALHLDPQTNRLSLESQHDDGEHQIGPQEIVPGRRTHVAAVRAANEHRLYVDGVCVAREKIASPLVEPAEPFVIGDQFAGTVEELRVSTITRYDEDFVPATAFEPDRDTLALYHVSAGTGETLVDSSGHNHAGQIVGAKWVRVEESVAIATPVIRTRDLLQGLEPSQDGLFHDPADDTWKPGAWTITPAGLRSGNGWLELYRFPVESLPREYSLRTEFEADSKPGAVIVALELGSTNCYFVLNNSVAGNQRQAGFGEVDGKENWRNQTTLLHAPCNSHERHVLQLDVRTDDDQTELVALLDGKQVTKFDGKTERLGIRAYRNAYDDQPPRFAIGSMSGNYVFHRVEVTSETPVKLSGAAREREIAAWILARGGNVHVQFPVTNRWQTYRPGDELPRESFILRLVDLHEVKDLESQQLENLVGADRMLNLELYGTAIDNSAAVRLAHLSGLQMLNFSQTRMTTSSLAALSELRGLTQVSLNPEQIDDRLAFVESLPALRKIAIAPLPAAELVPFSEFPRLRELHLPYQDAVDESVVAAIQAKNPFCRIIVGQDSQAKVLGQDPMFDAVLTLRKRGVVFTAYPVDRYDKLKPLTDEMLMTGQAWIAEVASVPVDVVLTEEERKLLVQAMMRGRGIYAPGQPGSDELARWFAENANLVHIQLFDSDLSDRGLFSLHALVALQHLNVTKTRVTKAGIDAFHQAVPGCEIKSDFSITWPAFTAPPPVSAVAPFEAKVATKLQDTWAKHLGVPVEYANSLGMKFVLIPPGEFTMGSSPQESHEARDAYPAEWREFADCEGPPHKVVLTRPFYLGVHEVTQRQFELVMGRNPAHFCESGPGKDAVAGLDTANHPVETVSWNDAAEFCAKLSRREGLRPAYARQAETVELLEGKGYRLPSEAQWEFATRAGTTEKYWCGEREEPLLRAGWFLENAKGRTQSVGQLAANPFGLFDMHGNVWEWMQDGWEKDYVRQVADLASFDPSGPTTDGSDRAIRSGAWNDGAAFSRSASRMGEPPQVRGHNLGLRVALPVETVQELQKQERKLAVEVRAGLPRDLLQGLNPAQDGLARDPADLTWKPGEWKLTPEGLKSGRAKHELYRLPVDSLPRSYSLLVEFASVEVDGALLAALELGGTRCYLVLNGAPLGALRQAGFGEVDGLGNHKNETTVWHKPCKLNEWHTLQIVVRSGDDETELIALLDGQRVTGFQGRTERLSLGVQKLYDDETLRLGIGSMQGNYQFRRVELRSLDPATPIVLSGAARDREIAAGVLARGGNALVHFPVTKQWQLLNPGEEVPREAFLLHVINLSAAKNLAGHELDALSGADRLVQLFLYDSAIDNSAVHRLARLPALQILGLNGTKVSASSLGALGTLRVLNHLYLNFEQIDDQGSFAARLPTLQKITASRVSKTDLPILAKFKNLRLFHAHVQGAIDDSDIQSLQAANPSCRILVGLDGNSKALGRDPVLDAVRSLLARGVRFDITLIHPHEIKPATDELLGTGQAWLVDGAYAPAEVILSDEERELLLSAISGGHVVVVKGQPKSDELARRLSQNADLAHICLSDCDLTNDGLASLRTLIGLRYLDVGKTRVSQAGVDAFHRAVPGCEVKSDFGTHLPSFAAPPPAAAVAPFDAQQAKQHQDAWAGYLGLPVEFVNSVGMTFRLVPPGEFNMGSTPEDVAEALKLYPNDKYAQECIQSELPQHRVYLAAPMYLAKHEVTQAQYEAVMGHNPSHFFRTGPGQAAVAGLDTSAYPVERVNWFDAAEFCEKLSRLEKLYPYYARDGESAKVQGGNGYRLPSEAQWEFACRAGTATKYSTGDDEGKVFGAAWLGSNSDGKSHKVGGLAANSFGLYDMHGNVYEWCHDVWEAGYFDHLRTRPAIVPGGSAVADERRVVRGGAYTSQASNARSSHRRSPKASGADNSKTYTVGFRVALSAAAVRDLLARKGTPGIAPPLAAAPFSAAQAKVYQEKWARHLGVPATFENSLRMKFRLIPQGRFLMGSSAEDVKKYSVEAGKSFPQWQAAVEGEAPARRVAVSPVFLGVHEVTQDQYQGVMGRNPSKYAASGAAAKQVGNAPTGSWPVESVSYVEGVEFCARLSKLPAELAAGRTYRIPSEVEWEYACRAGTATTFLSGPDDSGLPAYAHYWHNARRGELPLPVGTLSPNGFGLYDTLGNVWEYATTTDGRGQSTPVVRGGGWTNPPVVCRSACGHPVGREAINFVYGLRIACEVRMSPQPVPAPFDTQPAKE